MDVYHYGRNGEYLGNGTADPSPLEPGVWLIPANATAIAPPLPYPGKVRRFNGAAWEIVDATQEEPKQDPEYIPSLEDLLAAKMDSVNEGKNLALDAGFLFTVGEGEEARAVLFDSDAKARQAYLELAVKLGQDQAYSTPWKASRGVWVDMDAALFAAVQPSYEAHVEACFAWQAAREQELAQAYAAGDRVAMEAVSETM